MVNPDLVTAASRIPTSRILVTGGSGFIGSHLARTLAAAGHHVTACGRNPWRFPFAADGPQFVRCDLTDRQQMSALCSTAKFVFHAGALSAPFGPRNHFASTNIDGTKNVVDGCQQSAGCRLVHVSSTSIQFDFRDTLNVTESDPPAAPFACDYAWSKAQAEAIVLEQAAAGLDAVIVRARAVFGPGDHSLLPRLLRAADQGHLKQLAGDNVLLDLTCVDNLVLALIQAADRGVSGRIYTITNDEPVALWPFIRNVLKQTGREANLHKIPRSVALTAASIAERWHRWSGAQGEPRLTKYTAGLLSTCKTFDISAAGSDLGYRPLVSMEKATQQTIRSLTRRDESPATDSVQVSLFSTGYTTAIAGLAERGATLRQKIRFHALVALIEHPRHGLTLFDAGYSPRFFSATKHWPYRLYRWLTPVVTHEQLSAVAILRERGISPNDIRQIIVSHFHADHTCGLRDFPKADVITLGRCWDAVRHKRGISAVRSAFLPDLMPDDIDRRICRIDCFGAPGFGPFESTHDLFGDGSVRMVELSGHAIGQTGLLVQRGPDDRILLAADTVWTSRVFRENLRPTFPFRRLAASRSEMVQSQQRLHDLSQTHPDVEIIPTHCPEVAARYGFDAQVDRVCPPNSGQGESGP